MMDLNEITRRIIGCAIEVHRTLGPGLLEAVYEEALSVELHDEGLSHQRQVALPLLYKHRRIGAFRVDLIVEDAVVVEIKSVERIDPIFQAQVLTYLRLTGLTLGLLINFNTRLLTQGIRRYIL